MTTIHYINSSFILHVCICISRGKSSLTLAFATVENCLATTPIRGRGEGHKTSYKRIKGIWFESENSILAERERIAHQH